MSVITISRGSYSYGKEIAEKVARKLGYECYSRDIILEASKDLNIPELKLVHAIHDAPSILDRLSLKKNRYIAFIRAALLRHFRDDNVVYHGLAGHFFVGGISHVLKIRIIADFEERIKLEMNRKNISRQEAEKTLKDDDNERRKWSQHLYGIDPWDPNLYSLVIHIHKISADDAADIICHTAGLDVFRTTPESQRQMHDLCTSAEIEALLLKSNINAMVTVDSGIASIKLDAPVSHEKKLAKEIENLTRDVADIKEVRVNVVPTTLFGG
jgi:cytidylate kinase